MKKYKTIIIAEAGVNHNGKLDIAKKLVNKAKIVGADIVKFQTFLTEEFITKNAKKSKYQKKFQPNESKFSMLKKLELSFDEFKYLFKFSKKKKIEFLSTGFDIKSIKFIDSLKLKRFKIPSGEINNYPFLKFIGKLKKKIILSTGMSTLKEIDYALNTLTKYGTPLKKITVMHCNSAYPTPPQDVNLNAMLTIQKKFGVDVGYSDHTIGIEAPIIAVSLGAKIIEKHFTLNRKYAGPDHLTSIEPNEFNKMVLAIRKTEQYLGSHKKIITKSENINKILVRKSITARIDITKGEKFSENNLTTKRPAYGTSPIKWKTILGKIAKKNYKKDDLI